MPFVKLLLHPQPSHSSSILSSVLSPHSNPVQPMRSRNLSRMCTFIVTPKGVNLTDPINPKAVTVIHSLLADYGNGPDRALLLGQVIPT